MGAGRCVHNMDGRMETASSLWGNLVKPFTAYWQEMYMKMWYFFQIRLLSVYIDRDVTFIQFEMYLCNLEFVLSSFALFHLFGGKKGIYYKSHYHVLKMDTILSSTWLNLNINQFSVRLWCHKHRRKLPSGGSKLCLLQVLYLPTMQCCRRLWESWKA